MFLRQLINYAGGLFRLELGQDQCDGLRMPFGDEGDNLVGIHNADHIEAAGGGTGYTI